MDGSSRRALSAGLAPHTPEPVTTLSDTRSGAAAGGPPGAADWDRRLAEWPRAHLLQSHGWGEVQGRAGWAAHRLEVTSAGRTLPLLALVGDPALPGLPPRVYVPKGPAADPGDPAWGAAAGALEELAAVCGAVSITVEPPLWEDGSAAVRAALGPGWEPADTLQPRHTALVDLRDGDAAVLARMRPKGRYNARLAERRGVEVDTPRDPGEATRRLAPLLEATARGQGIVQPGPGHLRLCLDVLPGSRVHLARVEGEDVSGCLVAAFAGTAVYLYGGSVSRHRERQPSALLHLEAMRAAIAAGCHTYDLWGIPPDDDPGHPWHGLRQFKLSLGGVERTSAGAFRRVRRPVAARAATAATAARRLGGRLSGVHPLRPRGR